MRRYGLQYDRPARDWLEAFPVGNGHIGLMVGANPNRETLYINDDTLWSGNPDSQEEDRYETLREIRSLMDQGHLKQAQDQIENRFLGRFTQAFLPLGSLSITCEEPVSLGLYQRSLDFEEGIVKGGTDGVQIESFCSYPADTAVYNMTSCYPRTAELLPGCELNHVISTSGDTITLEGLAPSDIYVGNVYTFDPESSELLYSEIAEGIRFCCQIRVVTNGRMIARETSMRVEEFTDLTIYLSTATSFKEKDPLKVCSKKIELAAKSGYSRIRQEHTADFSGIFAGLKIDLGENTENTGNTEDTATMYEQMKQGEIKGYQIANLFQYGRYLLLSSSRNGTQPANLQGIWNKDLIPAWWSNYTLNINLQMNYWQVCRANLLPCAEPLHSYIGRLCENGKKTARLSYGTGGSVVHHQTDLWAHTTPVGFQGQQVSDSACFGMWNMALPWLCLHLEEYFAFSGDETFLEEQVLPVFQDCLQFLEDNLTDKGAGLINYPATSPENVYLTADGERLAIAEGSAMDTGIMEAFLDACLRIFPNTQISKTARTMKKHLKGYRFAENRVVEWDALWDEADPGHRHYSMLFGAYPGEGLLKNHQEEVKNSLYRRIENGGASTGWSAAWGIALAARLNEKTLAERLIRKLMSEHLHFNLFGAHPPGFFQIDTNFGFTAAVCELFVQEIGGMLYLMPCVIEELRRGQIEGLLLRGGHSLDLFWDHGQVTARIHAAKNEVVCICCGGEQQIVKLTTGNCMEWKGAYC